MALVACNEIIKGRTHTLSKDESAYTRVFRVVTDTPDDGPQTVRGYLASSKGIVYGVTYAAGNDIDLTSRVKSITPSVASDDGRHWDVTVQYGIFDTDSTSTSPLDEPWQYEWSFSQYEEPVEVSVNGYYVVNSAGDPFSEPITREAARPILSVSRNEASFNSLLSIYYVGAINLDYFQGGAPGTVRCINIGASRQYQEDFGYYWNAKYEFEYRVEGWDKVILDAGYRHFYGGQKVPITIKGRPVNDPALLNGQGTYAGDGANPYYKRFQVYPALPFSAFGI